MKKEKENEWMLGKMFVIKNQIKNEEVFEIVKVTDVGDFLIKYENLYGEEGQMMDYDFLSLKRDLWFSKDFYLKLGLKPRCYSHLIFRINKNFNYEVCNFFENEDYYFITVLIDKYNSVSKNYIFQKGFNVEWKFNALKINFIKPGNIEVFEILNKLSESKLWTAYKSIDELFEILGNDFDKIEFLKKLDPKVQFDLINRQPKYELV